MYYVYTTINSNGSTPRFFPVCYKLSRQVDMLITRDGLVPICFERWLSNYGFCALPSELMRLYLHINETLIQPMLRLQQCDIKHSGSPLPT